VSAERVMVDSAGSAIGWDDSRTARAYERFCRRHGRYREANRALVGHATLGPSMRVLDVAAGTGRTAEAALPFLGTDGCVLCVEPARAMRDAGARRLRDARVTWAASLPDGDQDGDAKWDRFDRVLCGAAIWQLLPLESTLARLAALVARGGALCFDIPAAYLLEADEPGGGADPRLLQIPALVERASSSSRAPGEISTLPGASEIDGLLIAAGLRVERWSASVRLTQAAYRDWLKIPVVSEGLMPGVAPAERERRLDAAYARADRRSWRWERWIGWTAWRDCA
jgi:SAM-dependent methyltransferase